MPGYAVDAHNSSNLNRELNYEGLVLNHAVSSVGPSGCLGSPVSFCDVSKSANGFSGYQQQRMRAGGTVPLVFQCFSEEVRLIPLLHSSLSWDRHRSLLTSRGPSSVEGTRNIWWGPSLLDCNGKRKYSSQSIKITRSSQRFYLFLYFGFFLS